MSLVMVEERPTQNPSQYWGLATLNSEATLNSLSLEMIHEFVPHFRRWKRDANCVGVFLQGAGDKAFCAGGDIKRLYQSLAARQQNPASSDRYAEDFFQNEYSLDYSIHTFPKPFVVWGQGIVMGGGLGLLSGASIKIATESTKIAMPEITIGLFPDVGGSYFLNQVPAPLGLYLGLTGTRLNASDCRYAGLVDAVLPKEKKSAFIEALLALEYSGNKERDLLSVRQSLQSFALVDAGASPLHDHRAQIEELMTAKDPLALAARMQTWSEGPDEWLAAGAKAYLRGCPTSAHIIWEQLERGRELSLRDCFEMELNLAHNICRFDNFREGVRALLIDKDNRPAWRPATLTEVSADFVNEHFKDCGHRIEEMA